MPKSTRERFEEKLVEVVLAYRDAVYSRPNDYDGLKRELLNSIDQECKLAEEAAKKETMRGLQKEWLYRRELFKWSPLRDTVDNLVGGRCGIPC
jgi:hypothetical protein